MSDITNKQLSEALSYIESNKSLQKLSEQLFSSAQYLRLANELSPMVESPVIMCELRCVHGDTITVAAEKENQCIINWTNHYNPRRYVESSCNCDEAMLLGSTNLTKVLLSDWANDLLYLNNRLVGYRASQYAIFTNGVTIFRFNSKIVKSKELWKCTNVLTAALPNYNKKGYLFSEEATASREFEAILERLRVIFSAAIFVEQRDIIMSLSRVVLNKIPSGIFVPAIRRVLGEYSSSFNSITLVAGDNQQERKLLQEIEMSV